MNNSDHVPSRVHPAGRWKHFQILISSRLLLNYILRTYPLPILSFAVLLCLRGRSFDYFFFFFPCSPHLGILLPTTSLISTASRALKHRSHRIITRVSFILLPPFWLSLLVRSPSLLATAILRGILRRRLLLLLFLFLLLPLRVRTFLDFPSSFFHLFFATPLSQPIARVPNDAGTSVKLHQLSMLR